MERNSAREMPGWIISTGLLCINIFLLRTKYPDAANEGQDLYVVKPGASTYDAFWYRDAAYIIAALDVAGQSEEAEKSLRLFWQTGLPGNFGSYEQQESGLWQSPWTSRTVRGRYYGRWCTMPSVRETSSGCGSSTQISERVQTGSETSPANAVSSPRTAIAQSTMGCCPLQKVKRSARAISTITISGQYSDFGWRSRLPRRSMKRAMSNG